MFNTSDTNSIIAALLIASMQYETKAANETHPPSKEMFKHEAIKYKDLELRMREQFYPSDGSGIKVITPTKQKIHY